MDTWLDRNRGIVFGVVSLLALVGAGTFYWHKPGEVAIEIVTTPPTAAAAVATPDIAPTATATPAPVRVYVSGAVQQSDVFFLPQGSIIKDAIQAAGGFTEEADRAQINLALELQDQQQIHVPRQGEEKSLPVIQGGAPPKNQPLAASSGDGAASGRINLNTASLEELDTLPGIGPAIAQRIIDFRESLGGFTAPDQITQVSGIGNATFSKIASRITVE